jgi:TatD DNase family protein
MKYIDCHCHIEEEIFDKDRKLILAECAKKEILIINCSGKPQSNRKALELSKKFNNLKICLGLYPIDVCEMPEKDFWAEMKFIEENAEKIVGIGEVGLDFYWVNDEVKKKIQVERFQEIIWLANKLKLPLNVHSRDAENEVLVLLMKTSHVPVILHSFGGSVELAQFGVKQGFFFSIAPIIVRSNRHKKLVEALPIQNLLTETDSPYLGPTKERNDPRNIPMIVEEIAKIKNMDAELVRKQLLENAKKIFNV